MKANEIEDDLMLWKLILFAGPKKVDTYDQENKHYSYTVYSQYLPNYSQNNPLGHEVDSGKFVEMEFYAEIDPVTLQPY